VQTSAFVRSSSWKPASGGSATVVRVATTSHSYATSAEVVTETRSPPAAALATDQVPVSRRATSEARRAVWLRAQASLSLRTAAGGPPRSVASEAAPAAAEASALLAAGNAPPRKNEEVRLEIESLKYYEVLKPIPVIVRPLGDRTFEAEVPGLNISTTGSSIMGVFLSMKSQIVTIVDRYRGKKVLSPEEQRQLAAFEKYIGSARRHWYAR
jgi:hypothetical protein